MQSLRSVNTFKRALKSLYMHMFTSNFGTNGLSFKVNDFIVLLPLTLREWCWLSCSIISSDMMSVRLHRSRGWVQRNDTDYHTKLFKSFSAHSFITDIFKLFIRAHCTYCLHYDSLLLISSSAHMVLFLSNCHCICY